MGTREAMFSKNVRKRLKTFENVAATARSKNVGKFSSEGHATPILRAMRSHAALDPWGGCHSRSD